VLDLVVESLQDLLPAGLSSQNAPRPSGEAPAQAGRGDARGVLHSRARPRQQSGGMRGGMLAKRARE
jgi:hypothetical protein